MWVYAQALFALLQLGFKSLQIAQKDLTIRIDAPVMRGHPDFGGHIGQALQSGRTRLLIGADAKLGDLLYRLWPTRVAPWLSALARRKRQAGA